MKKSFLIMAISAAFNCFCEPVPITPGELFISMGSIVKQWKCTSRGKAGKISGNFHGFVATCSKDNSRGSYCAERKLPVDCTGFDQFIFETTGKGLVISLELSTDIGVLKSRDAAMNGRDAALAVDLKNAKRIISVKLIMRSIKSGRSSGYLRTHGFFLRNNQEFAAYQKHWDRFKSLKWEGLLQPESYQPEYRLQYGLFFSDDDLDEFRKKYISRYQIHAQARPKDVVVTGWHKPSAVASRVHALRKTGGSYQQDLAVLTCSFYALLLKNKRLMRHAAKSILILASYGSWLDSYKNDMVGSGIYSAFSPSRVGLQLCSSLDYAGEMLTARGRDFVLKALMFKCVAPVTYSLWSRSGALKSNQGVSFLRGKIASLIVLDKYWPGVSVELKNTKDQLDGSLNRVFTADGSYIESTGYFNYTVACIIPCYELYSRWSDKSLKDVLPENLKKSTVYMEAVASTCKNKNRRLISIGQSHNWFYKNQNVAAFMAAACPDSIYVELYKKVPPLALSFYSDRAIRPLSLKKLADKSSDNFKPENFILLKGCALAASLRDAGGEKVKMLVVGDNPDVGKKHNDVGSFVLESGGDIFAMDMPVYTGLFTYAQYHNMLVPALENNAFGNQVAYTRLNRKLRNMVNLQAQGNAGSFQARLDLTKTYAAQYFKKWKRSIQSPNPAEFIITDEYILGSAARGAAFIWNTYLPCKVNGNTITISGEYGSLCRITAPEDCKIILDKFSPGKKLLKNMALDADHKCTRIIIKRSGMAGEENKLVVRINLIPAA